MLNGVEYKAIAGYPGYWISEDGIVRVIVKKKSLPLAKLVAMYFIPNPDGKKEVRVKGTDPKDCSKGNLEWI